MATAGSTGTINLTKKASPKVMERFKQKSVTEGLFNHDYNWTGVKTIQVYNIDTVPLNDYDPERVDGGSRFGNLINLGDTVNEYSVKDNKSFIYSLDETYNTQQMKIKKAGQCLRRELDEVVIPYVDKYRLRKMAAAGTSGNNNIASGTLTRGNIVETIMNVNAAMSENLVPEGGRVAYVPYKTAIKCKLADQVVGTQTYGSGVNKGSIGEKSIVNGVMGNIDGCQIKAVPSGYLPNGVEILLVKKNVCWAPKQLSSYKIHDGAHVLDGSIATGHLLHDCFVPVGRERCIFVVTTSGSSISVPINGTGVLSLADGTLDVSGSGTAYTATLTIANGAKNVAVSTTDGNSVVTGDVIGVYSADESKATVKYDPRTGLATITPQSGASAAGTVAITFEANGKPGYDSPANVVLTVTFA